MARPKKKAEYQSKLVTKSIKFTSRVSMKVKDNFYTIEACEERILPTEDLEVDWNLERKLLWEEVNKQCDDQAQEIYETFS